MGGPRLPQAAKDFIIRHHLAPPAELVKAGVEKGIVFTVAQVKRVRAKAKAAKAKASGKRGRRQPIRPAGGESIDGLLKEIESLADSVAPAIMGKLRAVRDRLKAKLAEIAGEGGE